MTIERQIESITIEHAFGNPFLLQQAREDFAARYIEHCFERNNLGYEGNPKIIVNFSSLKGTAKSNISRMANY